MTEEEKVLGTFRFQRQGHFSSTPFSVSITNQALVISRQKGFAVSDPVWFERTPLNEIRRIRVRKLRATSWLLLAVPLALLAGYASLMQLLDYYRHGTQMSHWPPIVLIVACFLPFAARRRYALVIDRSTSTFIWKTPFLFDSTSVRRMEVDLAELLRLAQSVKIAVIDERS
jgi:hypothetical protein